MVIETTQILLRVSCESGQDMAESKRSTKSGLRHLIQSTTFNNPMVLLDFVGACKYRDVFELRVELVEMLIKLESCSIGSTILKTVIDIVEINEMITHIPGKIDTYNEMMNIIGGIVLCFVIARADKVANELQVKMTH